MTRRFRSVTLAAAGMCLLLAALAACSSPQSPPFVGYKWTVVAIAHDGETTAIPARYSVFLIFTPGGQFIANEPVNTHGGTYRVTAGGFVTSNVGTTLVLYVGHDPVTLLAESAIDSLSMSADATASVAGNRLTVEVRGYTLTCQRDGAQGNFPQASLSSSG